MLDSRRLTPSKFRARPLGPDQLERDRLLALLEQHAHARLVLIHTPAGYGKTTLMLQWYQRLAAARQGTAWIWLDDDDNDAGRLGAVLSQALAPDAGAGLDLIDAINRCLQVHPRFTLFLDEEEHVTAPDAVQLLERMLDLSPANLHFVVGSRLRPQLLATRLRLRDDFLELTARDLAFRPDEIGPFMQARCGVALDAVTIEQLARRSEGWVAALQLAAAEIAQGESPQAVCAHLAGPQSDLVRYLSEEVLSQLPSEQRQFLLQTSFLSELSGPLCDAVTGRSDSEAMLLQLQQANLLLQPVDSSRRRFRYHALFADVLRQQLCQRHPQELPLLARRASDWCARAQLPDSAVEYALLAGDSGHLVACIAAGIERLITRAQFATATRWLRAVPPNILQERPDLLNWAGWVYLYINDFDAAQSALSDLERLGRRRQIALKERLSEAIQSVLLLLLHGRYDEALATTDSAWQQVTPASERQIILRLTNLRALLAQMHGRFGEAAQHAERALAIATQAPTIWLTLAHAAHISGMTELSLGNLSGAMRQFQLPERAFAAAREQAEPDINPNSLLALFSGPKALVLYELNRLDDAQDCLDRYAPFLSTMFSPSSRTVWHQLCARLRALRGDEDGFTTAIQEGSAYAIRHGLAWMQVAMQWERVDYDIARGDLNHARSIANGLLAQTPLDVAPEWILSSDEVFGPIIGALRFLIHANEARRVLNYLPIHIAHSERQLRRRRLIKLRVLEALALQAAGERTRAVDAMRTAVDLAHGGSIIRSFVDEGAGCLALLRELDRTGPAQTVRAAYLQLLLAAFDGAQDLDEGAVAAKRAAASPTVLSAREAQILQRLAQGHSNLVVGQQLFLSPNTIKWHLGQLYAKLGVRNRTQAIHVARQQNLMRLP